MVDFPTSQSRASANGPFLPVVPTSPTNPEDSHPRDRADDDDDLSDVPLPKNGTVTATYSRPSSPRPTSLGEGSLAFHTGSSRQPLGRMDKASADGLANSYAGPRQRRTAAVLREAKADGQATRPVDTHLTLESDGEGAAERPEPASTFPHIQPTHPSRVAPPDHHALPAHYAPLPQHYEAPGIPPGQAHAQAVNWHMVFANVVTAMNHGSVYAFSVLSSAIRLLRVLLALFLALFLLSHVVTWASWPLSSVYAPVCSIPSISSTSGCIWLRDAAYTAGSTAKPSKVQWADYASLVDLQSKTFDQIVDVTLVDAITPSSLSLSLKKTEMATADLIGLVRLSSIGSRNQLADALTGLVQDARKAGSSLARLDARMNGALDSIMAVNEYALHAIESAARESQSFGHMLAGVLTPWRQHGSAADMVVKQTFLTAMNVMSHQLEKLVLEVQLNMQNLYALEEKLNMVHTIVIAEDNTISESREELLGHLWKKLHADQKALKNFDRNLALLKDLSKSKVEASERVLAAQHMLRTASEEMEDMRQRVALPNLSQDVPLQVHVKIIQSGIASLSERRGKAKLLEKEAMRKALGT